MTQRTIQIIVNYISYLYTNIKFYIMRKQILSCNEPKEDVQPPIVIPPDNDK